MPNNLLEIETGTELSSIDSVTLNIELNIYITDEISNVFGEHSEIEQTGFLWDKTLVVSSQDEKYKYNTYLGGLTKSLYDGSIKTDFVSGTIFDLTNLSFNNYIPVLPINDYTVYTQLHHLYSDFSLQRILTQAEQDQQFISIDETIVENSISLLKFKRVNLINEIVLELTKVDSFTDNSILNEFTYSNNTIAINKNYIYNHGFQFEYPTYDLITNNMILAGTGNDGPKDFFLDYFPVISSTLEAYVVYDDETVERWPIVSDFHLLMENDAGLVINADLGVISCGGAEYDSLCLSAALSEDDTEISFFLIPDIHNHPTEGIILIDDEYIYYSGISNNTLLNCTRGYNNTIVNSHTIGSIIFFERKGYPIPEDASLYVFYQSSLKVEYETEVATSRTTFVDVIPSHNVDASKILEISPKIKDLDSLILTADKPSLGDNNYGPLYFGIDKTKLTVTALDSEGNPVSDLSITLQILGSGAGFLDGEFSSIRKITNNDGKIYSYYSAPIDSNDYSFKTDEVHYEGPETYFTLDNISEFAEKSDCYLFQIMKHDPSMGTVGAKSNVDTYSSTSNKPGASMEIEVPHNVDQSYIDGSIFFYIGSVLYTRSIIDINNNKIYVGGSVLPSTPTSCWLMTNEDTSWDADSLNGIPLLVYEYNSEAVNPNTNNAGAYYPMFPHSITGNVVYYNSALPEPEPDNINSNLGGYLLIYPISIALRAMAVDPYSGNYVYSNTIHLLIKLNTSNIGVDTSNKIPYGWNLSTLEENIYGNSIGGANFYTINKRGGLFGLQLKFNV